MAGECARDFLGLAERCECLATRTAGRRSGVPRSGDEVGEILVLGEQIEDHLRDIR